MNKIDSAADLILNDIAKKGRIKLFDDIMKENSDLYLCLYSKEDSEIYRVYKNRYDLIWLKYHWNLINEYIKDKKTDNKQKSLILSKFAKWCCNLVKATKMDNSAKKNNYFFMREIIDLKIKNLESIILFDNRCNEKIKRIETSFMKSLKLMNNEIEKLKKERNM